ncbi:unnamed protein product [Chrysoparadoxa australica]
MSVDRKIRDPDKTYLVKSKPKIGLWDGAIRIGEGDYECLANLHKAKVFLPGDSSGEAYPSVEHAYQASRTTDQELRKEIRAAKTGIEAKKLLRGKETVKGQEKTMEALLRDKFRRHDKYRKVLAATGHAKLVWFNDHNDSLWGVCGDKGKGENKLAKLLQSIRDDIRQDKDSMAWASQCFCLEQPSNVLVTFEAYKEGRRVGEMSVEHKSVVRLGKMRENDICMESPTVSRFHALLLVDSVRGPLLVCLGGTNGTFVDDKRLTPFTPEPVPIGVPCLGFGQSTRRYALSHLETKVGEKRRSALYRQLADPTSSASSVAASERTVYVGNLPYGVLDDQVKDFFFECGEVEEVSVPRDKDSGEGRGFAFVTFCKPAGVSKALTLSGDDFNGRPVKINRSGAKDKAGGGGREGGRGGAAGRGRASAASSSYVGHYGSVNGAAGNSAPPKRRSPVQERRDPSRSPQQKSRGRRDSSESPPRRRDRREERPRGRERRRDRSRSRDRDRDRDEGGERRGRRERSSEGDRKRPKKVNLGSSSALISSNLTGGFASIAPSEIIHLSMTLRELVPLSCHRLKPPRSLRWTLPSSMTCCCCCILRSLLTPHTCWLPLHLRDMIAGPHLQKLRGRGAPPGREGAPTGVTAEAGAGQTAEEEKTKTALRGSSRWGVSCSVGRWAFVRP